MLHEILDALGQSTGALCLEDLAQRLDINQAALAGMLQTLVQRGYLVEVADAASWKNRDRLRARDETVTFRAR